QLIDGSGAVVGGPVLGNRLGQYVVPTAAPVGSYKLLATCEAASTGATVALGPTPTQNDLTIPNFPPQIRSLGLYIRGHRAPPPPRPRCRRRRPRRRQRPRRRSADLQLDRRRRQPPRPAHRDHGELATAELCVAEWPVPPGLRRERRLCGDAPQHPRR